jgi:hypothetical protein
MESRDLTEEEIHNWQSSKQVLDEFYLDEELY